MTLNTKTLKIHLNSQGFQGLAEKEGFEPSRAFDTPTPLAGEPLRPLGYFSEFVYSPYDLPVLPAGRLAAHRATRYQDLHTANGS